MKKLILILLSVLGVLAGGSLSYGQVGMSRTGISQPDRKPRRGGYTKDSWRVYYRGREVKGASASSFEGLGGGYGKDNWKVFYAGQEVKGASASSFEGLGGGYGKDNWKVYYRGRELSGTSPASFGKLRPERR